MRREALVVCSALFAIVGLGVLAAKSQDLQKQSPSSAAVSAKQSNEPTYMDRLTNKLKLTPDQQAKIKPIVEDEQRQIHAVRQDDTITTQQRRERIADIRAAARPQIEAILTPDRQKKFVAMKDEDADR